MSKTVNPNKKIIIIRNAYQFDFGGAERMAVDLASEVGQYGWKPLVISRSNSLLRYAKSLQVSGLKGWWWSRQNWSGPRIVLLPLYLIWQLVVTVWYLAVFLKFQPDVVHIQSRDDFISGSIAARILGKKIVWTDHADLKYIFVNLSVWYKNPLGKIVYGLSNLADGVILVSDSEKDLIASAIGHKLPENFKVIHNGIKEFHRTGASDSDKKTGNIIYCCISRLVGSKGIGELLDAFKALVVEYPDSELWIIGGGPDEEKFKRIGSGIKNVVFVGHSDTPLEYLSKADIFVHPSYHEGFSLSILEAAMLGKPIIACDVGGNSEIISDRKTGLLIPPRDVVELTKAMVQLREDRDLANELGAAAHRIYEKNFRFETIIKTRYLPIYEK